MTDANDPAQWAHRLTEQIQHRHSFIAKHISDFEVRREASRQELAAVTAANDKERERELKWILPK